MLIGLFILIAAVAIFLVLQWSAKNDSVSNDGKTTGLFAMKDSTKPLSDGDDGPDPEDDAHKRPHDQKPDDNGP